MRPFFMALALAISISMSACSSPDLSLLSVQPDAGSIDQDTSPPVDAPDLDLSSDVPTDGSMDTADNGPDDTATPGTDAEADVRTTPRCGDGVCTSPDETCTSCPRDCGACPVRCGDHVCNAPRETCTNCPADCGTCDTCAGAGTCGGCTPMNNCGWCKNTNRCLAGTMTQPNNHECSGADWAWRTNECMTVTDPCPTFTNCAVCAAQPTCGWCANNNHCLAGNTMGPDNGSCRGADWRPMPATCRGM